MTRRLLALATTLAFLGAGCASNTPSDSGADTEQDSGGEQSPDNTHDTDAAGPCAQAPSSPPSSLGLDPFYLQYLDADGIPVVASGVVSPAALNAACAVVQHMLSERGDVRAALVATGTRVGVMAASEVTSDIPEHADLNTAYPGSPWDSYRGLGATLSRNITTVGEENVLRLPGDIYEGESILVHEFGHTVWELGVRRLADGSDKQAELQAIFDAAPSNGRWINTYAATDTRELWAEGTQSWFNANMEVTATDGIHNTINTRVELETYDPDLYALLADVYPSSAWTLP